MSTFRTLRPLIVEATQCEHSKSIATDTGVCNVSKGDWIVKGENGETISSTMNSSIGRSHHFRPILGSRSRKKAVITAAQPVNRES